jgi:hypothetical protein
VRVGDVELRLDRVYTELRKLNLAKIMTDPLNQESVNDTAKLLMHRLIARLLARDPSLIECARASLATAARRFPDHTFIPEWESLLRLPVCSLRNLLTSRDQRMRRLRLSSPFVTAEGIDFTDDTLRRRIARAAKRIATRASMRRAHSASIGSTRVAQGITSNHPPWAKAGNSVIPPSMNRVVPTT